MSVSASITIQDGVTPFLAKLSSGLQDKTRLNEFIAGRAAAATRDYLFEIAAVRHDSARKLGGVPTGHLERAAESVSSTSDADAAEVSVTSPGMARVERDLKITPVNAKYLTDPANAIAYGHRASEVARQIGDLRFMMLGGKTPVLAVASGKGKERKVEVFYWLKTSVTVPQDRTLLPSDQTYLAAAEAGAGDYFQALMAATA